MSSITMLPLATTQQEGLNMQNKQDKLVSGINIKTINKQSILGSGNFDIQSSGESSVFEAVYGVTTYDEIITAYNEGKYVFCLLDGIAYHLVSTKDNTAWFSSISGYTSYRAWCNTSNVWYKVSYELEGTSNKVKTISESSTDTQYPSAKAVYEALQNVGSGDSSVFEVVYGETPYNDIIVASKARKHVICYYKDYVYNLTKCQEGYDLKFSCADSEVLTIICKVNGGWSASNAGHEKILNKVTSLSDKSTNTQYPSAKAVYDFVNNTLGTIINGDY